MTVCRVLQWRGTPLQVKVRENSERPVSREMPTWFTEHADRVAMHEGLYGQQEYLEQYEWSPPFEREGPAEQVADQLVAELTGEWAPVRRRWETTGELC
jgi:hypothetical protein